MQHTRTRTLFCLFGAIKSNPKEPNHICFLMVSSEPIYWFQNAIPWFGIQGIRKATLGKNSIREIGRFRGDGACPSVYFFFPCTVSPREYHSPVHGSAFIPSVGIYQSRSILLLSACAIRPQSDVMLVFTYLTVTFVLWRRFVLVTVL